MEFIERAETPVQKRRRRPPCGGRATEIGLRLGKDRLGIGIASGNLEPWTVFISVRPKVSEVLRL